MKFDIVRCKRRKLYAAIGFFLAAGAKVTLAAGEIISPELKDTLATGSAQAVLSVMVLAFGGALIYQTKRMDAIQEARIADEKENKKEAVDLAKKVAVALDNSASATELMTSANIRQGQP